MKRFLHSLIVLMALAAAGQAFAQELPNGQGQINDKNAVNTQALASERCFSSGSYDTFLKVCVTDNGNISWFESPAGKVHLQQREGYAVCSDDLQNHTSVVHGFDANIAAEGWGNSTVSQPNGAGTFPLIITRKSLDGVIQLKQTFAQNTAERGVNVKIDVKNISGHTLDSVYMSRYFDGDIDNSSTNVYDYTAGSVWARDSNQGWYALTLTGAPTNTVQVQSNVYNYAFWDPFGNFDQYARGCGREWVNTTNPGDYVGGLFLDFHSLNAGETRTATVLYRRY